MSTQSVTRLSSIRVDLINHCNAKCGFCPYHGNDGTVTTLLRGRKQPFARLEISDFERLVKGLVEIGQFPKFRFSGKGEATIHPHFREIIELISKSDMPIRLITNGIVTQKFTELFQKHHVSVLVSIHGHQSIHDHEIGVYGAYQKAAGAVLALKEAAGDVSIATVITPENLPSLYSFVQEWTHKGIPVRLAHDNSAWRYKVFNLELLREFIKVTEKLPMVTFLPNLNGALLDTYYETGVSLVLVPHQCTRILHEVDLDSDGTLRSCRSKPFGNIKNEDISNLLFNTLRLNFIEEIQKETETTVGLSSAKCDRCCYQSPLIKN